MCNIAHPVALDLPIVYLCHYSTPPLAVEFCAFRPLSCTLDRHYLLRSRVDSNRPTRAAMPYVVVHSSVTFISNRMLRQGNGRFTILSYNTMGFQIAR